MRSKLKVFAIILAIFGSFYLAFIHYTDTYQVAIVWNRFTGELRLDNVSGFSLTAPWVRVARIDTRPIRVCVTSAARSYNCRLVQFEAPAYREFVEIQGFGYYWLANRISFNSGYDDEYRGVRDIMRGYAFSGKPYPFITIQREYEGSQ